MSAYFTFNANVSYLAESVFGQSEMMSAAIMSHVHKRFWSSHETY